MRGIAADAADALIRWCESTADGTDDTVRIEAGPNDPLTARVVTAPGFYAVVARTVRGVLARTKTGGFLLGGYTAAPTDAAAGEAGISVGGTLVRVKPSGDTEIKGLGGTTVLVSGASGKVTISCPVGLAPSIDLDGTVAVARDGDPVTTGGPATSWALWIVAVTAAVNALNVMFATGAAVLPTDFGVVDATSTKVRAG